MENINDKNPMTPRGFFAKEWGTGFTKATLSEKNGLLEISMEDIYSTMEKYAEYRLRNDTNQIEQFFCAFENDEYNKKCNTQCSECKQIENL